ncbi:MAG: YmdB family metallophosphoesterase [Spirochaetaceae bacterium]|nr:YmdB family metallophosphoesterase [Spirochaetaceae bacterium]
MALQIIMIGDVVGETGLRALEKKLPDLIGRHGADFTVVNGENAAAGFGLTEETLDRILAAGADVVTGGNHIWEKRDFWPVLNGGKPVLRPANYPCIEGIPGRGWMRLTKGDRSCVVVNLQGREQMRLIDCPFRCFDQIYRELSPDAASCCPLVVDFHAESTREKETLGYYLDGRAGIVAGTHTHVQTADERILPRGTAYISDLGMTGSKNSIIGMDIKICLDRARTQIPYRMECSADPALTIQGIAVTLEEKALAITRINLCS